MKSILSFIVVAFLFLNTNYTIAQQTIEVINKNVNISKGDQPAYIVEIPQGDFDDVLSNWTKLIRQNTKEKVVQEGHEIQITGTQINEIYPDPINIYSAIINSDSSLKLVAVFEIDSVFFNYEKNSTVENEKIHSQLQLFMKNFAVEEYENAVEEELEAEEKKLKELNKDLDGLTKENENLHKSVKENEQDIKNSEDAIKSYELDNERKLGEINSKKEAIASLSAQPELQDQAKDQLKDLEKEKKNISNKLEKEQKNIVKYQSNITEINRNIERNLELQEIKLQEINTQEDIVQAVKLKLGGIR
ncbi:MAG: hypothetical protein R2750_02095 [Bacteroidales bacterium]